MTLALPQSIQACVRTSIASTLIIVGVVGSGLTSCASSPQDTAESGAVLEERAINLNETGADQAIEPSVSGDPQTTTVPQSLPQLVKRAELVLEVDTVDEAIDQSVAIARRVGGDVLRLQNQTPPNESIRHTAFLELRVPQAQLESAIEQLSELGTVDQQYLTAEDVSAQLVDYEARLRNLRKAEETVLGIMERSGEIGDVLQVAQELRNIRQSIEQIDGQLASLRNRVAFSTLSLTLESKTAGTPSQTTVITQLSDSWTGATRSVADFTVALMQIGIWLLVYSPYWLILAGIGYGIYRLAKKIGGDRQSAS